MDKICGIYQILNLVNNKIYIGQSVNIAKRWKRHKKELDENSHVNEHLQSAWNKYGENNFQFSVLCECDRSVLNEMESYYINLYKSYQTEYGYNYTLGGNSSKRTPEAIEHNRQGQIGKKLSEEHKKNISNGGRGLKRSEETKRKISESKMRCNLSPETLKRRSEAISGVNNPMFGKKLSDEERMKISERTCGENHPFWGKFGADASHTCRVMCINTGDIFDAGILAAQWCGLKSSSGIFACIAGRQKTAGRHPESGEKLRWIYADDVQTNHCDANDISV